LYSGAGIDGFPPDRTETFLGVRRQRRQRVAEVAEGALMSHQGAFCLRTPKKAGQTLVSLFPP
jgi:hypothetical protein